MTAGDDEAVGEPFKRYAEAKLKRSALERVGGIGMRPDASLPEKPRRRGKKRGSDMERRRLTVIPTTSFCY